MARYGKHPIITVCFRFAFGQPLSGDRKTNATFTHRGDTASTKYVHAGRWAYLSGVKRMLYRWSMIISTLFTLWLYNVHHSVFVNLVYGTGGLIALILIGGGFYIFPRIKHSFTITRPILRSIAPYAHIPPNPPRPGRAIAIPLQYQTDDNATVSLTLDPNKWFGDESEKEKITQIMSRRLGMELNAKWIDNGSSPCVVWRRRPHPPNNAPFSVLEEAMLAGKGSEVVLGLGTQKEIVRVDIDTDAPHIAASIGTGGGKTSTLTLFIAQLVRKGVEVIIIDPKKISLNAFKGVPGVTIHRNIVEQVRAIAEFQHDMEARYEQLDLDPTKTFTRRVLILEEMNSFKMDADLHWQDIKERGDPKTPPVMNDIKRALFKGRQCSMHVFMVLQQANANAMGGSDARDQFGIKILARSGPGVWKMLVGSGSKPTVSNVPGRALALIGDSVKEIQLGFLTPEEARMFALGENDEIVSTTGATLAVVKRVERFSLQTLVSREVVPVSYDALRAAKSRDPSFPKGESGKYTVDEIISWHNNRPRTRIPIQHPLDTAADGG